MSLERPLTGEDIAVAAAADFKEFFLPNWAMDLPIQFGPVGHPCVRRNDGKDRIVLPLDMGKQIVTEPEMFLFHLLILGHEIAHIVNKHMDDVEEQSDEDYHSLELWADFYGAKVAMTLFTFGRRTSSTARRFFGGTGMSAPLEAIGAAAGLLFSKVYRVHRRYPPKLERVGLISNGVTSFLRVDLGSRFEPIHYFSIFKRVFCAPVVQDAMHLEGTSAKFDLEPVRRAQQWHRNKQGNKIAITPGFHPHIAKYLNPVFDQTDEELRASEEVRRAEIEALFALREDGDSDGFSEG